jgi:hypothetical protein
MRRLALALLCLPLSAVFAQSPVVIPPEQCVWRAGDNPAWAASDLDETGWQPFTAWHLDGRSPHIWIRCHADLSPLAGLAHPALQFEDGRAFEAFLNGQLIGSSGDLSAGWYTGGIAPVLPLHETTSGLEHAVIALHVTYRTVEETSPVRISAGDQHWLADRHDSAALNRSRTFMPVEVCYLAIGFAGFVLLAMYLSDRRRLELLLLAACCWCLLFSRTTDFIETASIPVPWVPINAFWFIGQCLGLPYLWFFFRLAGKRVPWLYRLLILEALTYPLQVLLTMVLPLHLSLRASAAYSSISSPLISVLALTVLGAPLVAFWPWNRVEKRSRGVAVCCVLWAVTDTVWIAFTVFAAAIPEESTMAQQWNVPLLFMRALFMLGVIVVMVALLFRDQRRTAEERALLVGEMQAARSVQQVIIPEAIPSVPGFVIESAYKPAGEVGGDFFQIVPTLSGGVLAVIGDVSGKGAPAAMTVSLLVGTFRTLAHYTHSPSEILRAMNIRMLGRTQGGFTTCLVVRIDSDGILTAANAGHIPPYFDGKEFALDNGLPLGLSAESSYTESPFQLPPGAQLTLLTDGVVEARNATGELFGFERTAAICTQPAEAIAFAAQQFGQEDDITVLTLKFAGSEVMLA